MFGGEIKSGVEAVTQTALDYNLLSQYTAFVAVSEEVRVEPDGTRRRVQVPVELPEGVSYEGIFGADDVGNMRGTANFAPTSSAAIPLSRQAGGTRGGGGIRLESDSVDITRQGSAQLEVMKIEGLEPEQAENAIASLTQHLQSLNLPEGFTGEIIFELQIRNGAVQRVILDDIESTLQDTTIVDPIRRSLLGWSTLESVTGTIRVTLRVP